MFDNIDQLRAAFKQNEDAGKSDSYNNNYYPFWKMNDGQQAIIRFLPDANEENPMDFFVEKVMHNLVINGEKKNVPCETMYGATSKECPICRVSSAFYKKDDEENGKKYWRKKQYLMQALVVEDPLPANTETGETYEGKVCCIALGFQLYEIIKEASLSGELDTIPYKFKDGVDFIIKKTPQGKWSTYTVGSGFKRKNRDLTDEEIATATEGMIDLSTLLPKRPEIEALESMLAASLTEVDEDVSAVSAAGAATSAATTEKDEDKSPLDFEDTSEAEEVTSTTSDEDEDEDEDDAEEILAKILQRKGNAAS